MKLSIRNKRITAAKPWSSAGDEAAEGEAPAVVAEALAVVAEAPAVVAGSPYRWWPGGAEDGGGAALGKTGFRPSREPPSNEGGEDGGGSGRPEDGEART